MKIAVVVCCALLVTSLGAKSTKKCPVEPEPALDSKFHPGQIWRYKTRPGEDASTITILKIESLPKPVGTVVHVRVDDVHLTNCTGGPTPERFEHMPFTREALDRSITTLVKNDAEVPDLSGYRQWLADCGGVYTITVAEAINVAQKTFSQSLGCNP